MSVFLQFLAPFLMAALGLGAGVWVARRYQVDWGVYAAGALTFIGSQVFHIPFNAYLLNPWLADRGWDFAPGTQALLALGVALGLSAGVFEECARYLTYRFWQKEARSWRAGVMLGAGHGGIEAILLGGLALYAIIQLIALRDVDLSVVVPAERLPAVAAQVESFWNARWYDAFLGVIERASTIPFHIALSLTVLQAVRRRSLAWLALSIAAHTLLNALAVYGAVTWGIYLTEAGIVLAGLVSLAAIWAYHRLEPPPPLPPAPEAPLFPTAPPSLPLTPDSIEDSRYAE